MIYVYIAIAKDFKPVIDYLFMFIYINTHKFIIVNLYTYSAYYICICAFFSSMIFFSFSVDPLHTAAI